MFCPGCGTNNEDGARFCYRCGRQLNDGTTEEPKTGPAWKDFAEAVPESVIEVPVPPIPVEPPPLPSLPIPRQIVLGKPKQERPLALIAGAVLAIAALAGGAAGIYFATQNNDSLPLLADDKTPGPAPTSTAAAIAATSAPTAVPILASLTSTCKDTNDQACNLIWDFKTIVADAAGLRIDYEVRATGQAGCAVAILADPALAGSLESAGRPGPHLEGARGRYYPLRNSEGLTNAGGNLGCGPAQRGAWVFAPVAGETFVKLRYPGLPPVRIELQPIAVTTLPPTDPPSVIAVQQSTCQTADNQQCSGLWEIGPYGLGADGSPIIFFAVRFDGPAGCQINWQDDVAGNARLIASGNRGIGLELAGDGGGFLQLAAGGGLSSQNGPQSCGTVLTGFWRFAPGNVSVNVNLIYPDFPPVQVSLKP